MTNDLLTHCQLCVYICNFHVQSANEYFSGFSGKIALNMEVVVVVYLTTNQRHLFDVSAINAHVPVLICIFIVNLCF